MDPGRPGRWRGLAWLAFLWEFPGSCLVTGVECVDKPLRAGLKPTHIPQGEGRAQTLRLGGNVRFHFHQ